MGAGTISYVWGQRGFIFFLTTLLGTPLIYLVFGFFIALVGTPASLELVSRGQHAVHDGDVSVKDKLHG